MMLTGATVFAGDSITVGLAPFVTVAGDKLTVAKGGQSSAALLAMLRAEVAKGTLLNVKNIVVLAGTNDIGGGLSAEAIFGNLQSVWAIGKNHGWRVVAITIPPAKGYSGWNGRDDAVDAKRRAVNALIHAATLPDAVVDSDSLMGANGRLLPAFDSGDHLHPRKDAMGAALTQELARVPPPLPANPGIGGGFFNPRIGQYAAGTVAVGAVGWGIFEWWKGRKR